MLGTFFQFQPVYVNIQMFEDLRKVADLPPAKVWGNLFKASSHYIWGHIYFSTQVGIPPPPRMLVVTYTQTVVAKLHAISVSITEHTLNPTSQYQALFSGKLTFSPKCSIYAFSRYMNPSITWSSYTFPPILEKDQMVVSRL